MRIRRFFPFCTIFRGCVLYACASYTRKYTVLPNLTYCVRFMPIVNTLKLSIYMLTWMLSVRYILIGLEAKAVLRQSLEKHSSPRLFSDNSCGSC